MMHRYSLPMRVRRPLLRPVLVACSAAMLAVAAPVMSSAVVSSLVDSRPWPDPPKDAPTTEKKPDPKDAPRSLDDLLGVPEADAKPQSAEDAARREQEKRLEKSLDEASMQGLVQQAVDGMKSAADRLMDAKDAGLGTQRIQEEVVRTLDRLLEEAKRQQQKQKSSRSSQGKKSKDQKSQDPSEQNGQNSKPSQQQRSASASKPSDGDASDAEKSEKRGDEVADAQELEESRIEWGRLPERVRELVLQGRRDRVSTIYERLTREYYKRLAEEASR